MDNKRSEERICRALPVNLGNTVGITRDISASGMSFETSASLALGSSIKFMVDFEGPMGKMVLKCLGQIVRAESLATGVKVGVKIIESRMEIV